MEVNNMITTRIAPLNHTLPARRFAPRAFDLDRFFDSAWRGLATGRAPEHAPAFTPRVDIHEDESAFRICAELPGLEEGKIEVEVEENVLSISGERKEDTQVSDGKGIRHLESLRGQFRRSFRLPDGVDTEAVKASYSHGVLEVNIPKPVTQEPEIRTIPVEAG